MSKKRSKWGIKTKIPLKIRSEWEKTPKVSALGFEPRTNGLKGQNRVCASYDQEPTNSALSIGRRIKKVSWMLILKVESTRMCPVDYEDSSWISLFPSIGLPILPNPLEFF
jgi:hypothetical protein